MDHGELPTTSYAILGLLAIKPWTAYELTQQVQRSLRYCWPKAETVLYEEPRRLASLGWAQGRPEQANGRTRTRYVITAKGRHALQDWLARESAPPKLEIEPLLRLIFADQGTKTDALQSIAVLRRWADDNLATGRRLLEDYAQGHAQFPERLHVSVLFVRYFADIYDATVAFCDCAEKEIAAWERVDGLGLTTRTRQLLDEMLARHRPDGRPRGQPQHAS